ncbi:Glycosyltransferase, GT2 family [Plantibacter flavus]|uniref:GT2 family glycosyltransferase n=1 Tax=Plantibacter flavus TaxID=150123 RepID=A0A3N2C589_9MICO|nr:glycosyltransferase [Plantibacter flavus]ROR82424.1 GT2 family glycosyltransferase [Plantibacter flavus]SMG44073.1 Glycosyltransferase, GT2 family [Plantibacter flavus]
MYSIVIPCRNGSATLADQLEALLAQQHAADVEIIVADNGSTDGTAELVRRFIERDERIRLVDAGGRPGINHARNVGILASRGTAVLLCDADDVVRPGWVEAHVRAFELGADCVGGPLRRVLPNGTTDGTQEAVSTLHRFHPWPPGANCGVRRDVFDRIGGFDESLRGGGDETDFFWRAAEAGHPTTAVPEALVEYRLRENLRAVSRQFFAYGRGTVRLFRRHRSRGMPRSVGWDLPAVIAVGVLQIVSARPGSIRRRRGVERLASRAGRLVESVRSRTWYL